MPPANLNKSLILDLYRQGVRQMVIARSLGCSPQYVSQTIKQAEDPEWKAKYLKRQRAKGVRAYRRKNPGAKEYRPRPKEAEYRHYPGDPYDPRSKPARVKQPAQNGNVPVPECLDPSPGPAHQSAGLRVDQGQPDPDDGQVPGPACPFVPG